MINEIFDKYGRDPFALFQIWMEDASANEINDPTAFCLATADAQGRPSARMVLMKELNENGFKFHTNAESRKGCEIAGNPYGALCMHWKSLRRQVRAEGRIEAVSTAESDVYFLTRPRARQIGAWASAQSRPYNTISDMSAQIAHYEDKFGEGDIPRPPYWQGFRLVPERIEFWLGNRDRLHTRFEFTRDGEAGAWEARWLFP